METTDNKSLEISETKEETPPTRQLDVSDDDAGKKYLSETEALKLELNLSKLQLLEKNRLVLQLQLLLEEKGVQIEQFMFKEKLHTAQEKMKSYRSQIENIVTEASSQKENNLTLIKQISEAHSLGGNKFGYNPETLEIVCD